MPRFEPIEIPWYIQTKEWREEQDLWIEFYRITDHPTSGSMANGIEKFLNENVPHLRRRKAWKALQAYADKLRKYPHQTPVDPFLKLNITLACQDLIHRRKRGG